MFSARFDDLVRGQFFGLAEPVDSYAAMSLDEVIPVLDKAVEASRSGLWVAGYVAYDSAPAFDGALVARSEEGLPFAWFGSFAATETVAAPRHDPDTVGGFAASRWTPLIDRSEYESAFRTIHDHVGQGDAYQVNLTFPMQASFSGDPDILYQDLVTSQHASNSCLIRHDGRAVVSISPETFFSIDGDRITTRPMKGTRPRGRWAEEDAGLKSDLLASEKDRAENLMIVDLIRNDLGRVSEFGSVIVDELFGIEAYETVWQMTSEISATLRSDTTLVDVFRALFPCGSVTGAPKARAMEIIAEVESRPRGVYCGAIGFLPPGDGRTGASFSVAIRTATVDDGEGVISYSVGGGITWGSDADGEFAEASTKAQVLTADRSEIGLLETIRWDSGWVWIEEHIARLVRSAEMLNVKLDEAAVRESLEDATLALQEATIVRLRVENGSHTVSLDPAPGHFAHGPDPGGEPVILAIDMDPVDDQSRRLYHKTSDRSTYVERLSRHDDVDDVILVNDRGFVTETTIANLVFRFDDRWVTPPVGDGLLPGIMRAKLLEAGSIEEESVHVSRLVEASAVGLVSSVRGWRPAHIRFGLVTDRPSFM